MKPVHIRPLARAEVLNAAFFYHAESGEALANDFADEIERAYSLISATPGIGTLRYAHVLPGLRMWPVRRFPYLIFYLNESDYIDVLRVLHARRDIPEALRS